MMRYDEINCQILLSIRKLYNLVNINILQQSCQRLIDFLTLITMFKNLWKDEDKRKRLNSNKSQIPYARIRTNRIKARDDFYSYFHQARKSMNGLQLDFHLVENQCYIYQGEWQNSEKNGQGIAFMKNGTLIVGHWLRDKLNGRALIFNPYGSMLSVEYVDNKLNGWAIAQFSNKVIIANTYFQDKVDGYRITYEASDELWILSSTTNSGQFIEITYAQKGTRNKLPRFIMQGRLTQFLELTDLFQLIVVKKDIGFNFTKIKSMELINGIKYIGFVDEEFLPFGLGATFSYLQCFMGLFDKGFLTEFGRMIFRNGDIYHGQIYQGNIINRGIYYYCKKNSTIVIETSEDGTSTVTQQKKGYYHIDFKLKIGARVIKQDEIKLSHSTQTLMKILENYYRQYSIQARKKQQQIFSISTQKQFNTLKLNDIDETNQIITKPKRKGSLPKQFIRNNDLNVENYQELTQQVAASELLVKKLSFSEISNNNNRLILPKLQKKNSSQFFSIAIKENQLPHESEKHDKKNPQSNNYKQKQFIPEDRIKNTKSLQVKQATFRNCISECESKIEKQIDSHSVFSYNIMSQQQQIPVIEVHQVRSDKSKSSDNISNIQEKLSGIMKKTYERRKIFE